MSKPDVKIESNSFPRIRNIYETNVSGSTGSTNYYLN